MSIEYVVRELDRQITRMQEAKQLLLAEESEEANSFAVPRKKYKMSVAARRKIGEAQRKRWAKAKAK